MGKCDRCGKDYKWVLDYYDGEYVCDNCEPKTKEDEEW